MRVGASFVSLLLLLLAVGCLVLLRGGYYRASPSPSTLGEMEALAEMGAPLRLSRVEGLGGVTEELDEGLGAPPRPIDRPVLPAWRYRGRAARRPKVEDAPWRARGAARRHARFADATAAAMPHRRTDGGRVVVNDLGAPAPPPPREYVKAEWWPVDEKGVDAYRKHMTNAHRFARGHRAGVRAAANPRAAQQVARAMRAEDAASRVGVDELLEGVVEAPAAAPEG